MISHEYPKIALLFLDAHCSKFHFKVLETIVIIRIGTKELLILIFQLNKDIDEDILVDA